jgi:hypothetical protein
LRTKGIVDAEYLSVNKRDRTLFYSVNREKLRLFFAERRACGYLQKPDSSEHINEHMGEHMYIEAINSKQIINKSNKSKPAAVNIFKKNVLGRKKPTIIQDMVKIWKEEISSEVILTPKLCSHLVKIFEERFDSSLKEWKRYLQLIKTSKYLMRKEFKLTLFWTVKFITVDRIRAGELGVKKDENPFDAHEAWEKVQAEEREALEKAQKHIELSGETEKCKEIRKRILKYVKAASYNTRLQQVRFTEEEGRVKAKYSDQFTEDWIRDYLAHFLEREGVDWDWEKARKHIELLDETEKCKEIRRRILNSIKSYEYNTWFGSIRFAEEEGRVKAKYYPNEHYKRFVQKYFADLLEREGVTWDTEECSGRPSFQKLKKGQECGEAEKAEVGYNKKIQLGEKNKQSSIKTLGVLIENLIRKYHAEASERQSECFAR